ncbi:MAG: hypothetical protein IJF56_02370 [Clostridia bacterium]|nr:hypothetical protein [Clostridia bacterium]
MKIEFLFPEVCNLYGDSGNMRYLKASLPEAVFIETPLCGTPRFTEEKVDLVYMGGMTENTQARVIEKLRPLKDAILREIEAGTVFLCTGNAMEVFGDYIENEDGSRVPALGIFRMHAKRNMTARHNSAYLGEVDGIRVMGFKTQFTMAYDVPEDTQGLFRTVKGVGLNRASTHEGVRVHNFFGTYLVGPLLVLNPPFTRYLLEKAGAQNVELAFAADAQAAYDCRLAEFENPAAVMEKSANDNSIPLPAFLRRKKK